MKTVKIIDRLEERVAKDNYINTSDVKSLMKESSTSITSIDGPYVIMVVGVNGVGKTTTIGKLAHKFKKRR